MTHTRRIFRTRSIGAEVQPGVYKKSFFNISGFLEA
jgi:hypothetical protein